MADNNAEEVTQEQPAWVYGTEEATYDVKALEETAQQAFALLIEVNAEVGSLNKRVAVLQAAGSQLNSVIQSALKAEAIIETNEGTNSADDDDGDSEE